MIIVQAHDLIQYKCLIPDIECFAKYVSVVCSQSPKRLNVLLGYMCHIVRVSHRYKWLSWFAYNQNLFRSSRQWNKRVGMHRSQPICSVFYGLGLEWGSLMQVLPLAWPQHWYLPTETPSTQTLKACPSTGPCCQRSVERISLERLSLWGQVQVCSCMHCVQWAVLQVKIILAQTVDSLVLRR